MDPSVVAAMLGALIGAVAVLLVAYLQARHARNEDMRRRRTDVYMAFCGAALDYRRAALNLWDVRARRDGTEAAAHAGPAASEDVRATRAAAWTRYYEVLMLSSDKNVVAAANAALQSAAAISRATTPEQRESLGDRVHEEISAFAEMATTSVRARRQEPPVRTSDEVALPAGSAG